MPDPDLYRDREQTRVKHEILRRYLARFARIVGSAWKTITYVDCFSGPWQSKSASLEDTSFAIALEELRGARKTLLERRRGIRLRCFFLEREASPYRRLASFAASIDDVEIETLNAEFEDSIPQILKFVRRGGSTSFPFFFIDPTGWTGYDLEKIRPLLRHQPGEVLINFMTGHINRLVGSTDPEIQRTFHGIYGDAGIQTSLAGMSTLEREDAVVREFASRLRSIGGFKYAPYANVLRPDRDRVHFHLVYGTRSPTGLEVFKDVERAAMGKMEHGRAVAGRRRREQSARSLELFDAETMHDPRPFERRRSWYREKALTALEELLRTRQRVSYDEIWESSLQSPMVWESDIKGWISEARRSKRVDLIGLRPGERVVKRGQGHIVAWRRTENS